MKKRVLKSTILHFVKIAEQREARADELLASNGQLLERARAAETDRRLALELLALARAILVPGSGETADKIADFLKERGL